MKRVATGQRLADLRKLMQNAEVVQQKLNAYIVPSQDAHNSQYTHPCHQRRAFMTGFTGSYGTAVVTLSQAVLWTAELYHLQASKQIDENWTLMKEGVAGVPSISQWLCANLNEGDVVGIDPYLCSKDSFLSLDNSLSGSNIKLEAISPNLVDAVWGSARPAFPTDPPFIHQTIFAGLSWQEKLDLVRLKMEEHKADMLFLSALDEIAWLFNLRGTDIAQSVHFFAYAIVGQTYACLLISEEKVTNTLREHLTDARHVVELQPYSSARDYLILLSRSEEVKRVWLPPGTCYAMCAAIGEDFQVLSPSPVLMLKAVKNDTEAAALVESHARDSVAICLFLSWLKQEVMERRAVVTELSAARKLEQFRQMQELYLGPSFSSISSVGSNASIIHYKPTEESDTQLCVNQLYLIDSGGQYQDGTTDVTRTVMFESLPDYQRECYTRVVKGHIALAKMIFPDGCAGYRLDSLARQYLWEIGLDYRHGTGHGVGFCSCVHEGPIGFSTVARQGVTLEGLKENMVITIEPGYYVDNEFGVRLENVYIVKRAEQMNDLKPPFVVRSMQSGTFLRFEPLTLVPIQLDCLILEMLTEEERIWIDRYNGRCRDVIGEKLAKLGCSDAVNWMLQECRPIQ